MPNQALGVANLMGKQKKTIRRKCVRERCLETEEEKKIETEKNPRNKQTTPHQTLRWVIPKAVSIRRKAQSKGQCQGKGHTFHNCRDVEPWRRKWQPTPVLLPAKPHGWRSLVGNSPWGRKESDTTERLHFLPLKSLGSLSPHSPSHG